MRRNASAFPFKGRCPEGADGFKADSRGRLSLRQTCRFMLCFDGSVCVDGAPTRTEQGSPAQLTFPLHKGSQIGAMHSYKSLVGDDARHRPCADLESLCRSKAAFQKLPQATVQQKSRFTFCEAALFIVYRSYFFQSGTSRRAIQCSVISG